MKKAMATACLLALLLSANPAHGAEHAHRDFRLASGVTAEEIDLLVDGTGLTRLGPAFAAAERAYGVNALALLSIAILESGWGRSWLATTRHNLFGINHSRWGSFQSKTASVIYTGNLLKTSYFSRGRTNLKDVGRIYAEDPQWSAKVARIWAQMERKVGVQRDRRAPRRELMR